MLKGTCTIEGCDKPLKGHGWCGMHYTRWRSHGDPLYVRTFKSRATEKPGRPRCVIAGCGGPCFGRGWCSKHYTRWRRWGDPLGCAPRVRRFCSAEGCTRELDNGGRGLCSKHYQRWKLHGGEHRVRPAGDNSYEAIDLLTGRLAIVKTDGSVHAFTYDLNDHGIVSQYRWHVNGGGYACTSIGGRANHHAVPLHRMLLGLQRGDGMIGDHINGDRTDNRRINLRVADHALNAANQAIINERGTSKYRGVCWDKNVGRWKAYAHLGGRLHNLGFFPTEDEAAAVAFDFRAAHHIDVGYPRRHAHTPTKRSR